MNGRTLLPVALSATAVVAVVTGTVLQTLDQVVADSALIMPAVIALGTIGALLAVRVPSNPIGWLLLVSALALGVETLAVGYASRSGAVAGGSWPGTVVAFWLYSNLLVVPVLIMTIAIPLIYPDGRLLSPRWRWLVALLIYSGIETFVRQGLRPGLIPDSNVENPFGIAGIEPLLRVIDLPQALGVVLFLSAVASVVIRYRRGGMVERQQLKWLIAITAIAATAWSLVIVGELIGATFMVTIGWLVGLLAFAGFPVAIGIAILRYRLYEIDRIISRTISWALVTGTLVACFVGLVVGLSALLQSLAGGSTFAVAGSTLVVFALFQPLRRRIQVAVDRRFDRARYDARRTAEAFAERLRNDVDLASVQGDLLGVVVGSLQPASVAIWTRNQPEGAA